MKTLTILTFLLFTLKTAQAEEPVDGTLAAAPAPDDSSQPETAVVPRAEDKQSAESGRSLYEQFRRGGLWMYPILVFSFVAMAFAMERMINLRRTKIIPSALAGELNGNFKSDQVDELTELCKSNPSCLGRILQSGLGRIGLPLAEMERASDEQSQRELYDLRKNIRPLGIVANVAPMLGLLGTISGMISAFEVVATHGALGDPKLLSGSISEALLTTGFGLTIAIPSLLLFHYFRGKSENLIVEISDMTDHVLEQVGQSREPEESEDE